MELQFELMVFTLFICLAAGTFALQGLLALAGRGKAIQTPALICSLVALVIGGLASFLHLQHWDRIFNGFGNPTSGITQELIAIVVFFVALVVYFVLLRRSGEAPKWAGAMALIVSVALVVVMASSYNMAARPVWDTPLLWLYYIGNAALFGSLAVACIAGIKGGSEEGASGFVAKAALVSGVIAVVATAAYAAFFASAASAFTEVGYYFDPVHPTKPIVDVSSVFSSVLSGDLALLFWLGVVVAGLLVPLVLAFIANKKAGPALGGLAGLGLVCALVGGMCFRVVLYTLGFSVFVFY